MLLMKNRLKMLPNEPEITGADAFEPGLRLEGDRLDSALPSDVDAGTCCDCPCCIWRLPRLGNHNVFLATYRGRTHTFSDRQRVTRRRSSVPTSYGQQKYRQAALDAMHQSRPKSIP